jgi:hypothetical protein
LVWEIVRLNRERSGERQHRAEAGMTSGRTGTSKHSARRVSGGLVRGKSSMALARIRIRNSWRSFEYRSKVWSKCGQECGQSVVKIWYVQNWDFFE